MLPLVFPHVGHLIKTSIDSSIHNILRILLVAWRKIFNPQCSKSLNWTKWSCLGFYAILNGMAFFLWSHPRFLSKVFFLLLCKQPQSRCIIGNALSCRSSLHKTPTLVKWKPLSWYSRNYNELSPIFPCSQRKPFE
jgi:hypothetical protein